MYGRTTGISTDSGVVVTYIIIYTVSLHEEYRYEWFFRFRTFVKQSYGIFYSIPVAIMISSIDLTELKTTILSNLHEFDELWNPLASPSKSCDLATRDQPGMGFVAPWRLAFIIVLRADFTTWAPLSASLAER